MKFVRLAAAAALATAGMSGTAFAQDVAVGATVYGPEGNVVGTVESIADGVVTLDTGAHKAPLPANAFGKGDKGPTITVTKAQLDDMVEQQLAAAAAKRDAALVEGAAVATADGQALGTVKSIDGDSVVVERSAGPVELKREHFAVNESGALMALFTAAQIDAAVAGAATADAHSTGEHSGS
jgi:hypothetical protein